MRGVLRQIFCGLVGGLGLFITGCWLGWPSAFLLKLRNNETGFSFSSSQISWGVSLMDLANSISPIPAGYLMDICGRKPTFMATAVFFQLSWIITIIAKEPILIYTARILAGIGKGMAFTVLPMYIAEVAQKQIRGALSTIFTLLLFGGTLFEYIIGPRVNYLTLNIISSIVPLVFFILCFFLPESPYHLISKGKMDEAWKVFCFLRKQDVNEVVSRENAVKAEMDSAVLLVQMEMESKSDWLELVRSRGNRRACLALLPLAVLQRFGGISCLLAYSSTTLPAKGGGFIGGPEDCVVYFGLLLTVANFLCMLLVDVWGRKPLMILSNVVLAFVLYATATYFVLESDEDFDESGIKWIPYASILVFAFFYSMGIGVIPNTLLGEYFPANIKGKAAATATIFFSLASFSTNWVYPPISEEFGYQFMFFFFATSNIVTIFITLFVVYETKNKSFAEIQEMLKS